MVAKNYFIPLFIGSVLELTQGFYIPGVAPKEYMNGEAVDVKAVKMSSTTQFLPFEYYSLPFCRPKNLRYRGENIGEILRGDRITNTPYILRMNENVTCRLLCPDSSTEAEASEYSKDEVHKFVEKIKHQYRAHWIVDNLPSATRLVVDERTQYLHGFPIGYVDSSDRVGLFNHVTIIIKIHQAMPDSHRIVGFEIKAGSFDHQSYKIDENGRSCTVATNGETLPPPVFLNPDSLQDGKKQKVIWSYGVRFEPSEIAWASRWDTYLKMADVKVHWIAIINSFVCVIALTVIFGFIFGRTLSRDIARYNEEDDDEVESTGWKLVHGDVFRPPQGKELLATLVGTGVQLLGVFSVTLFFALLGMLSPASRGALMTVAIVVWLFMGLSAGYYSSRFYKTLGGDQWKRNAMLTACLFPSLVFGIGFVLNLFIWSEKSSGAVPFTTMLFLLFMWFGGSVPLVLAGAFFGFRKGAYKFPISVNQIPRQIPEQPTMLHPIISVLFAGILPFGAVFIELFFIMTAIWENQFYYMFGFLFLVFVVLIIVCAEITIVMVYIQLCAEDYRWWWRSVFVSGGCAIYVWLYSVFYFFRNLEVHETVPAMVYFGYSTVMAIGFFILTGTIGFVATFMFTRKIYAAVKID
eukprot:m.19987 g.19987  ORF g.19987 m.19987 type:complete len:635 (+) comp6724_c0_seq1:278-2182(+)